MRRRRGMGAGEGLVFSGCEDERWNVDRQRWDAGESLAITVQ